MQHTHHRRQLKSTTKSQAAATADADDVVKPLEVIEFAGLFIIW